MMKLVLLFTLCVCVSAFRPLGTRANVKSNLQMAGEYDALTSKLVENKTPAPAKKAAAPTKVQKTKSVASSTKAAPAKKEVKLELVENPADRKKEKAAPTKQTVMPPAPKKVETAPVKAAAPVKIAPSYTPSASTELSGGDVAVGVGLGLAPYLLIPVVVASGVNGLLKKPARSQKEIKGMDAIAKGGLRRNPAEGDAVLPRAKQFDKSLGEGAAQGIKELQSGNVDQGTKNGLKLNAGSLGLSAVGLVALFALGQKPEAP